MLKKALHELTIDYGTSWYKKNFDTPFINYTRIRKFCIDNHLTSLNLMCITKNFSSLETIQFCVERENLNENLELLVANNKAVCNVSLQLPISFPESYYEVEDKDEDD